VRSGVFSIMALVIGGIIVADVLINAPGVKAASGGVSRIESPAFNALLGKASK
jgi:hypothetical protein